jgi:hypothetical protein
MLLLLGSEIVANLFQPVLSSKATIIMFVYCSVLNEVVNKMSHLVRCLHCMQLPSPQVFIFFKKSRYLLLLHLKSRRLCIYMWDLETENIWLVAYSATENICKSRYTVLQRAISRLCMMSVSIELTVWSSIWYVNITLMWWKFERYQTFWLLWEYVCPPPRLCFKFWLRLMSWEVNRSEREGEGLHVRFVRTVCTTSPCDQGQAWPVLQVFWLHYFRTTFSSCWLRDRRK